MVAARGPRCVSVCASIFLSLALLAVPASLAAPSPADARWLRPARTILPPFGFFDDALALSEDGSRLALVVTDGAGRVEVHFFDTRSAAAQGKLDLAPLTLTPERLLWSSDREKLLVVARDLASGSRSAAIYAVSGGKLLRRLGPVDGVALHQVAGSPCFVLLEVRRSGGRAAQINLTALDDRGLEVRGRRSYAVDERGFLRGPEVKILYWRDAFTRLVGLQPGAYDATRDIRQPDRVAVVDALAGKVLETSERGDLVAFTKRIQLREAHPNQSWFVHPGEDLTALRVLWPDERGAEVALAEPFRRYDPSSLRQQLVEQGGKPDSALLFSLAIDPVNPDAVAEKRRDPEVTDFYFLPGGDAPPRQLGRIARAGRPLAWATTPVAGPLVVLRKHKGFDRGGPQVEIFPLPLDKPSGRSAVGTQRSASERLKLNAER